MPATSDHDNTPGRPGGSDGEDRVIGQPYTRVEAEVMEILKRADRPTSFTDHVRRKAARARRERIENAGARLRGARRRAGSGTFLAACLGFALFAYVIRDASSLLATVFALASVVCLFWPVVKRVRQPSGPSGQRWRGREMDFTPPPEQPRWARDLRDRFRRPPRR